MAIRAITAFTDPRTERVYQPGDIVEGLSDKRAELFARKGWVVDDADGLRPYHLPVIPMELCSSAAFTADGSLTDMDALRLEYDQRYLDNPEKWADTPERNEAAYQHLRKHLKHEPESVIDVGCGNGHTLAFLQKKWPNAAFWGIDLSREALKLAAAKTENVILVQTALEHWENELQFEVVVCLGTAEHFVDLTGSLSAMKRLIKPGGYGYIEVPHNLAYSPGEQGFRRLERGSRQIEWHLERDTWEKLLFEAELEIQGAYVGDREMWRFLWVVQ